MRCPGDMQQRASRDKILTASMLKNYTSSELNAKLYNNIETVCLFFTSDNTDFIFETHGTHSWILYSAIPIYVHITRLFSG